MTIIKFQTGPLKYKQQRGKELIITINFLLLWNKIKILKKLINKIIVLSQQINNH